MVVRQRMMLVVAAGVLSVGVGVAAPVVQRRVHRTATPPTQGLQSCNSATPYSDCSLVLLISSKDDDWTASGGAMRGLDK
jgi:hypothetical protein